MERIMEVVRRELGRGRWSLMEPMPPGVLAEINHELTDAVYREMPVLCPSVRIRLKEIALKSNSRVVAVRVEQVYELETFQVGL